MKYKELQITKHSLQHYIRRPTATSKELSEERHLLVKITNEVDKLKERHGIN
ncbi:hypothetical protein [Virgibacillus ndiopensis]|uniref:hypothetical protein n=1 Tax=Virgibacillus ndiopensis TaxID=2004408 RepID=UPI00159B85E5|nr:hypothetical protein [Virgibacillus ndiopensis]